MARIRSIHPDCWKSRKLAKCSAEAERLYWRLQPACDDHGRVEDDPELLTSTLFPLQRSIAIEAVDAWLNELDDLDLIQRYETDTERVIQVQRWSEYQHPQRPKPSRYANAPVRVRDASATYISTGSGHVARSGVEKEWSGYGVEGESEGEDPARRIQLGVMQ
ncbi:MAG: hypothetical protein EBR82_63605 [Caulobacteraceae bacterium]|nr:hypothetical protein [Caulobacteraceae bacterium]